MTLFLKNAVYIDPSTFKFIKTNIKINEGPNKNIEFISEIPSNKNSTVIDCSNKYVTQSFTCGHHHAYSALALGMGAPKKNPKNFVQILKYIWWTLDKCLDLEMVEYSALVTAIACAKNGVTFVIDHHSSPNAVLGSLETIAKAFEKVGVSHLLCYEISDRDGKQTALNELTETENYIKNNKTGLVGLHASFTLSDATIKKAVNICEKNNSGIHIHVAEDIADQQNCENTHGKRVIERLKSLGVLNFNKTILAHCLHLNNNEKNILKKSKAWIAQNPDSNLNNSVGYFNSSDLNNNIMLGTDGMHSDILRSAKSAFFVGKNFENVNFNSVYNRFRNTDIYLKSNGFAGCSNNNLVILDYDTPTNFNQNNFLGHFFFGLESKHILHVISNGKLIVKDKKLTTINETDVLEKSKELSVKLWNKMQNL